MRTITYCETVPLRNIRRKVNDLLFDACHGAFDTFLGFPQLGHGFSEVVVH